MLLKTCRTGCIQALLYKASYMVVCRLKTSSIGTREDDLLLPRVCNTVMTVDSTGAAKYSEGASYSIRGK